METAWQPSTQQNVRNSIAIIEAIELALLAFAIWSLGAFHDLRTSGANLFDLIVFLFTIEGMVFGSWVIYNGYIRIARAGGRLVDIGLWVGASILTWTFTFWSWTVLDINRFLISKLFYRGEVPIEYAWSARSKQIRKFWEQAQKAGKI